MSLIAMLEGCKDVAIAKREEAAAQSAQDVAEFEEFGADLEKAFDEQELAAAEEALRLGEELDEQEEARESERVATDLALAKKMLEAEEETENACSKDELIAEQMAAHEKEEAMRVAKLERRERKLAERKLCKSDLAMAEQLAEDIDREEEALRELERKDRKLARALVKEESKVLKALPQTEEKLKTLSRSINGGENATMRTRLFAKLQGMRKGLSDMTNKVESGSDNFP